MATYTSEVDVLFCHSRVSAWKLFSDVLKEHGHIPSTTPSPDRAAEECYKHPPPSLLVAHVHALQAILHRDLPSATRRKTRLLALIDPRTSEHELLALRSGAHAMLTQEVDSAVFEAQVRALLNLAVQEHNDITFGDFTLSLSAETLRHREQSIHLTPTEFLMLSQLARSIGTVVSKQTLSQSAWGHAYASRSTMRVHIGALRHKLEQYSPDALQTVRGRGYRLIREPCSTR